MRKTRFNFSGKLIWLILIISLAVFLTACGGDEPESDVVEVEAPVEVESAAEEEASEKDELEKAIKTAWDYFDAGEYEKAVEGWTIVIEMDAENEEAYYERGLSYFNLKSYDEAIADLTQAIAMDAQNADAFRVRGKAYGFQEKYTEGIADLTQCIALDPGSDEAYFNRGVLVSKSGSTREDLKKVIADCAMVIQIGETPDLVEQASNMMQNLINSSDDTELVQMAEDALEGKTAPVVAQEADVPTLADMNIDRPPGHSIGFDASIAPNDAHRFLFLASPGDTVGAGISSSSDLLIGIQATSSGEILGAVPSNDNSLFIEIPRNELYHIVIEDAGGQGGDYVAAFEASEKVSFALNPNYFMVGRIPEDGLLYYTYTARPGETLTGNVVPHPDTPIDLLIEILELESQAVIAESNLTGVGENEQFSFTVPGDGSNLMTYIVSIKDVAGKSGAYILAVKFE